MATPPNFLKIGTMEFARPNLSEACSYYAGGRRNLIWPVSMVGGETTPGSEAFMLPWVSVAGVYLHSGGQRGFRYTEVGDQEARSGAREKGSVWCTRLAVGCYLLLHRYLDT